MIGQKLGHYTIVERIGAGGMGVVYRARDEHLARDVAIKVLPAGTLADDSARRRFRAEAEALARLNHPHIATVHDFNSQEGTDFLVMEYVPGSSLSDHLASGSLPEKEVLRLGMQVAAALQEAHENRIVHRDLKPANIRLTAKGDAKVLDFGLAKLLQPVDDINTQSLTQSHAVVGTLPYMAPEQLRAEGADARTDIYAFGCVLYEMTTGRRPFRETVSATLTDAILNRPAPSPRQLSAQLSGELERIILKCLEKDPENRYQSAKELLVDLRRLATPTALTSTVQPSGPRRWGRYALASSGFAALLVALLVAFNVIGLRERLFAPEKPPGPPSIAVLPFADMSPTKDQEYFADGLAEELLNRLANIPELRVVARTSSFQFKGKNEDLRVIGEKLNVTTILDGSVRKEANRVRVTAQLINTADGFHLWSETYDREMTDVFALQDEIARSVAGALKVTLLGQQAVPVSRSTQNIEAYSAYLQGRYFFERRSKEDLEKAIGYFEEAINLDAAYAPAWAGLGATHSVQANSGFVPVQEGYEKARQAVERALALDQKLAEAHAGMGWIKKTYDWDWAGADASFQQALSLAPGNAGVIRGAAALAATLGRFEEAVALNRRAVELDPLDTAAHSNLGLRAYYAGRLEASVAAVKKALELNPEYPTAHSLIGLVYLAQSRPQEALAEMEQETHAIFRIQGLALAYHALGRKKESDAAMAALIEKYANDGAFQIAEAYAYRGEADQAFEWLERAYAQRDGGLSDIKGDPLLKNLERDPRYAAFLKKMRLPA